MSNVKVHVHILDNSLEHIYELKKHTTTKELMMLWYQTTQRIDEFYINGKGEPLPKNSQIPSSKEVLHVFAMPSRQYLKLEYSKNKKNYSISDPLSKEVYNICVKKVDNGTNFTGEVGPCDISQNKSDLDLGNILEVPLIQHVSITMTTPNYDNVHILIDDKLLFCTKNQIYGNSNSTILDIDEDLLKEYISDSSYQLVKNFLHNSKQFRTSFLSSFLKI